MPLPSVWKYTVCVVNTGRVLQEVKAYNNFEEPVRMLERLNALYAVKAHLEWDDTFCVIATRE